MAVFDWIRRNWLAVVVLAAIALSFYVNRHDQQVADDQQRLDNVASCVRANTRGALTSAWQRYAVENARTPGVAENYAAFSRGSAAYLAIANYIDTPSDATRVRAVTIDGEKAYVLTDTSYELIAEGCARAFHAEGDVEKLLDGIPGVPRLPQNAAERTGAADPPE